MAGDDHDHHPKDALGAGLKASAFGGTAGFFWAALQNALQKNNVGAMAVFTRSGGIIVSAAVAAGTYGFTKVASANLREEDDALNTAIAGAAGGAIYGISHRTVPGVLGCSAVTAVTLGVFELTGARLRGWTDRPEEEEFERKMKLRANRRRPMEETIAEIGEGRGIQPPGYDERRRERILEKYGYEINPVRADGQ